MSHKKHPGDIECAALTAAMMIVSKLGLDKDHETELKERLEHVVSNYLEEQGPTL